MIKLSNKSTHVIIALVFVFFTFLCGSEASAIDTTDYYVYLKDKWKLSDYNLVRTDTNKILESELTGPSSIVICNTEAVIILEPRGNDDSVECNALGLSAKNSDIEVKLKGPKWYTEEIVIAVKKGDAKTLIIIPEVYINTPDLRKTLDNYFAARNSSTALSKTSNISYSNSLLKEGIKHISLVLAFSLSVTLAIKILTKKNLQTLVKSIYNSSALIKPFAPSILFVYLLCFVPFLVIVVLFSKITLFSLIFSSVFNIYSGLAVPKALVALIAIYAFIGIVIYSFLYVDSVANLTKKKFLHIVKLRVDRDEFKPMLILLFALFLFSLFILPTKASYYVFPYLGLLLLILGWKAKQQGIKFETQLIAKVLLLVFTTASLGFYTNIVREPKHSAPTSTSTRLLTSGNLLVLPHTVEGTSNKTLFANDTFEPGFPVFANEYLVYYPAKNSEIKHNYLDGQTPSNGYIVFNNEYDFVSEVAGSDTELESKTIYSSENSEYFEFSTHDQKNNQLLYFSIKLNCAKPKPVDIAYEFERNGHSYLEKLISIPECTFGDREYISAVNPKVVIAKLTYKLVVDKTDSNSLLDYYFVSEKKIPINKYDINGKTNGYRKYLHIGDKQEVSNVYVFGSDNLYTDMLEANSITENINTLLRNGRLEGDIILWSPKNNAILYTKDE